ncbi:MAG TPA: hypothetical protein VF432_14935 [Thermoanaerobaculia bacterium]
MHTTLKLVFALALSILPVTLRAESTPQYTRFLMPIHVYDVPGAYGSVWRSQTWFRYSGAEVMYMAPYPFCFAFECTLLGPVNPGRPPVPIQYLANVPDGAILVHVESAHADEVTFESRIWDVSRAALSAGTEIPVVREDRMSAGPFYFLNIPIEPRLRATMRLYALPDVEQAEVEVRYFRQPDVSGPRIDLSIRLLRVERVMLRMRPPLESWDLFPAFAEIGNIETFPELAGEPRIWVEIVPLTPGMRAWGLVSLTNNETQQVTIISPQN